MSLDIKNIIKDYKVLKSIWLVGEKHNISGQKIHAILNKNGVDTSKKCEFTIAQQNEIKKIYETLKGGDGQLNAFCEKHGKGKPNVSRFAKKHGFSNKNRKYSIEAKEKQSEIKKQWHKENEHPKGMKGKAHTENIKKQISKRSAQMWKDPKSKVNSDENKQRLSDNMMKAQALGMMGRGYSRGAAGWYNINGKKIYFRSSWEVNYALYLDFLIKQKQIISWEYESKTFWFEAIKRGVRSYKPDFEVLNNDKTITFHEVKGYMDAKSKTKLKRMAKYYPNIKVIVIDAKPYKEIIKKLNGIIKFI